MTEREQQKQEISKMSDILGKAKIFIINKMEELKEKSITKVQSKYNLP